MFSNKKETKNEKQMTCHTTVSPFPPLSYCLESKYK